MLNHNILFLPVLLLAFLFIPAESAAEEICNESLQPAEFQKCLIKKRNETYKKLDKIYHRLLKKVEIEGKVRLRLAMDYWTAYFWAQCDLESYKAISGKNDDLEDSLCAIRLMNEYVETLTYQLNCEEGDLSCVL